LLAAVLAAARILSIQGFVKPVRVVSGSMAPALLGTHYHVACGDCRYPVRVDATQAETGEHAVCPNCGFAENELNAASLTRGDRVLIDRGAIWLRSPRRWEAIALPDPLDPGRLAVKRIAGLPGESIEIRGGELYADGRLVRKSLDQLRELRVPVYDDRYRPRDAKLPPRWEDESGGWSRSGGRYSYPGDFQSSEAPAANPEFAWLTYRHWRCSPLPGLRTKASPVLDDYGYNLGPPRSLNPVTDLMFQCRIETVGEGCLAISLHDGRATWEIRLWPRRGEASLLRAGREAARARFRLFADETPFLLEAAICDRQVLAAIDGAPLFAYAYERGPGERSPSSRPIALGAAGLAAEASELIVYRDAYWLPPPGQTHWTAGASPAGAFLLLGDNAPISQDSRVWQDAAVDQGDFLGPIQLWRCASITGASSAE
jgi:signal peptidase I